MSVYIYKNKRDEVPFLIWLKEMKEKNHSVFNKAVNMLESMHNDSIKLVRPNIKKTPIRRTGYNNLFKIRLGDYRAFFIAHNHDYYVLHAFVKKTQKTKEKEFKLAVREIKEGGYIKMD